MTTLLLLLVLHGLFLAVVLAVAGVRHDPGNRWLAALTLVASLLLLHFYLSASGAMQRWPHLAGVLLPAWLLIAPLAYRYVQAFLRVERPLKIRWIVLPALLSVAWLAPFYSLPAEEKVVASGSLTQTVVLYTGFWVLTGWCAFRAWLALRDAQREGREQFDHASLHTAWLRVFLAGLTFYALFDAALTLSLLASGGYPPWAGLVSVLALTALLYGVALLTVLPEGVLARAPWPGRRYQRAEMPATAAQELSAQLEQLMKTRQPWLDDSLGQQRLATMIGVSPHQLSQLLSQHLGASFADYVNGYRVREAQRLLREAGATRTVMDIGLEAGFASNATFYRAFRRHTGMAPRDYLATNAASGTEPLPRSQPGRRA
ncbi:MAG: helix-turn-helix domain-containing protein [Pseudomonadota bacterium]